MKIVFASNYINHHQLPFSNEMIGLVGDGYTFIQTEPMDEERVKMGWDAELCHLPFVRMYSEDPDGCMKLINDSDVVIWGGAEREDLINDRLQAGKFTIRYSERLYREGRWKAVSPRGLIRKYHDHTRYRKSDVYLLCAGAYVAGDFDIIRAYPERKMKWGYFPELRTYSDGELEKLKGYTETWESDSEGYREGGSEGYSEGGREGGSNSNNFGDYSRQVRLMWAGRFMELKHPGYAVMAAIELKRLGIPFHLTITGGGDDRIEAGLHELCRADGIEDHVTFTGFMKPDEVRDNMEKSDIFLFTSDHLEGWGAVVNEAMNSGCAVVACSAAGAVPYLIEDGRNGFIFREKDTKTMIEKVVALARDEHLRLDMGKNAYETIAEQWNAHTAAENLMEFIRTRKFADEGPCSRA